MVRIRSPEAFCWAPTNIGTIAKNAMLAITMVTSNSTKLNPRLLLVARAGTYDAAPLFARLTI